MTPRQKKQRPKPKRRFYATLHIDIRNPPTTMRELLEALFKGNVTFTEFAYFLVKKARDGGWNKSEWPGVILEFLVEHSKVYNIGVPPEKVSGLLDRYHSLNSHRNTKRNNTLRKEARAIGLNLDTWYYRYRSVYKRLVRGGFLYIKEDHFGLSKGILKFFRDAEDALTDFYSGREDEVW